MNIHQLLSQSKENTDLLTIEATVITGFEFLALDECREKCKPVSITKAKGRIFFNIPAKDFNKVLTLRSVDNVLLVIQTVKDLPFEGNKDKDLEVVKSLVDAVDWDISLKKWAEITKFKGILYPNKTTSESSNDGLAKKEIQDAPKEMGISSGEKASNGENESNGSKLSDQKDSEVSSNILSENDGDEKTGNMAEPCGLEICLSKTNEEEIAENNSLVEPTEDVINEVANKLKEDVVKTPQELEITHLLHEREENHISDKETPQELDKEENNTSEMEKVTKNNETKYDALIKNECNQENFISFPKDSCKVDSTIDVISEEVNNVCVGNELINEGDNLESNPTSGEKSSSHMEECSTTRTTDNRSRKKQSKGRNRPFDQKKPGTRRGQRESTSQQDKNNESDSILKFRATCYRIGEKHSFSSMEAACEFGGTLQDKFGWTVDLTRFNLNVVLNIEYKQGYICVAVTKESLHRRNITHFNNTTLRATMCYNLFRLAEPMTGEIVIDPLCGGGSISIEGALSFPNTFHICGDYNGKAIERTRANTEYINRTQAQLKVGTVLWNVKNLPLKPQSIDVLVTDLPFGKRSGAKRDNLRLYNKVLFELAKVMKTGTGRACLLTYDKTSLIRALRSQSMYWREIRQFGVNQGGLFSSVFLLLRKATVVPDTSPEENVEIKNQDILAEDSPGKMSPGTAKTNDKSSLEQNIESTILNSNTQNDLIPAKDEQQSAISTLQDDKAITQDEDIAGDKSEDIPQKVNGSSEKNT